MSEIKIPKSRIAVLVGVKGSMKRKIEKLTNTKISIDSKEGDVEIISEDQLNIYQTEEIIRAIGRGFNPEIALTLLNEEICFELIDLKGIIGKSKTRLSRVKARLIGTDGKCRKLIEKICNVHICIYGRTVGVIGKADKVQIARAAIRDILKGAPHGPIYRTIEERTSDLSD